MYAIGPSENSDAACTRCTAREFTGVLPVPSKNVYGPTAEKQQQEYQLRGGQSQEYHGTERLSDREREIEGGREREKKML